MGNTFTCDRSEWRTCRNCLTLRLVRSIRGPGARQVRHGERGEVIANEVLGEDGAWYATDEPPPERCDDDQDWGELR